MRKKYYFAYGADLNIPQMLDCCPQAQIVGWAEIPGHDLLFRGTKQRCGLTIEPGAGSVYVGVWRLTAEDEYTLGRRVGRELYRAKEIELEVHLVPGEVPPAATSYCSWRTVRCSTQQTNARQEVRRLKGTILTAAPGYPPELPESTHCQSIARGFAAFGFPLENLTEAWARSLRYRTRGEE